VYLVESLLTALVKEGGESLVLHVGERPAVVTPRGTVEIASSTFALESVDALLDDILSPAAFQTLLEFGVVEAEIAPSPLTPLDRFSAVVARGGDDVWIEMRRRGVEPQGVLAGPATPATPTRSRTPAQLQSSRPSRAIDSGRAAPAVGSGLERLLRAAAERGAEALYLSSGQRPTIRVDGEIAHLQQEPELGPGDVEGLTAEARSDPGPFTAGEWSRDVSGVGRVRCTAFVDRRGPGAVLELVRSKAPSVEDLGLSPEVRALASAPDGLVLISGPRDSGKSMLLHAFVDLIARTRGGRVVTLETRPGAEHVGGKKTIVSQREFANGSELAVGLRAALRERPDVLVVGELLAPAAVADVIEAAAQGHLIIAGVPAPSTADALTTVLDLIPDARRPGLQKLLARTLRGVVAQVLVRKNGGGRIAAREVLLGTTAVTSLIGDGEMAKLPTAIEGGRRQGMVPLNDALLAFVQSGAVEAREAWRRTNDRAGLLARLKREGIDTSFAGRLTS
jgi:twitching motility protein PilT